MTEEEEGGLTTVSRCVAAALLALIVWIGSVTEEEEGGLTTVSSCVAAALLALPVETTDDRRRLVDDGSTTTSFGCTYVPTIHNNLGLNEPNT